MSFNLQRQDDLRSTVLLWCSSWKPRGTLYPDKAWWDRWPKTKSARTDIDGQLSWGRRKNRISWSGKGPNSVVDTDSGPQRIPVSLYQQRKRILQESFQVDPWLKLANKKGITAILEQSNVLIKRQSHFKQITKWTNVSVKNCERGLKVDGGCAHLLQRI